MVDDDKYGLSFLRSNLQGAGYLVTAVSSVEAAKNALDKEGPESFAAVLTDYRMPGNSGLDLLEWVRERDEALATIMITAAGQKELVKKSLQAGAVEFLEKPISHRELLAALEKAIAETGRRRKHLQNAADLAAVGRLGSFLNTQMAAEVQPHLQLFYQPLHDIGGDFLNVRMLAPGRIMVLAGDVSGHDVTAGYVSSYFQGLVRAGLEEGRPVVDSLELFNRILYVEWGPAAAAQREVFTSLAVATVEVDLETLTVSTTVAGFPPPLRVDRNGCITSLGEPSSPLGWMPAVPGTRRTMASPGDYLLLFSDGLTEWADELEIDPLGLAFSLLQTGNRKSRQLSPPTDDLILLRFQTEPGANVNEQFHPIIQEHYAGCEVSDIDQMETVWRRTLIFALEEELGERIFDLLICIREAVLNALVHGCESSASKVCSLEVSYRNSDRRIRVRVDDPGVGHGFDLNERLAGAPFVSGRQLGLGMIQYLSDAISFDNRGTSIHFDFVIDSTKHTHG